MEDQHCRYLQVRVHVVLFGVEKGPGALEADPCHSACALDGAQTGSGLAATSARGTSVCVRAHAWEEEGGRERARERTLADLALHRLGRDLEGRGQRRLGVHDRSRFVLVLVDGLEGPTGRLGCAFDPLDVDVVLPDALDDPLHSMAEINTT